ncbi:MAG: hypothetical protein ACT4QC_20890 [Planctomycetaceae bacterium]
MIDVKIRDKTWKDFLAVARKKRRSPAALMQRVLESYLQTVADEELIAQSQRDARRARFRVEDTEEIIRQFRRNHR